MSFLPSFRDESPEPEMSGVCVKLENQFTDDLSKAEAMKVFARIRPMLNSEVESGYKECIVAVDEETVRAVVPSSSVRYKSNSNLGQGIIEDFKFTSAYGPDVGQFVFFEETMMNTMQNFIEGQNSLVFSYGITGSGKTFTLQGNPNNPGIIPLSLHLFFASVENQLLDKIVVKPDKFDDVKILNYNEAKRERQLLEQYISAQNQEDWNFRNSSSKSLGMVLCETFSDKFVSDGIETTLGVEEMAQAQSAALMKELGKKSAQQQSGYCSVWVSFAEIYNEYVYDLLQPNINQRTKLLLGEDKNGDVYVKGLTEVCVFNSFEALNLLNFGQKNLKIASTKLNYQSSRSHCIFTIKVIRVPDSENISYAKVSRLSFCDLAGSERAAKSQTSGMRLKEAGCINTSLLVLGRCLEQLRINPSPRDRKRIPFRESKLTRLFSGFFTGKGKAVMITNASPSEVTFDETLHALRFSAVATELIINDSYIATASNTLQTITNMWTNARANVSASSDRSISFEDSTLEALQEKDELIEKLLDLAESLTKNLEKEKKEKAELEIKIRREVSQEYSEYSDELLDRQKSIYEEEKESIREIYKKRIAALEKMYEKVIQSDESDSSGEEEYENAETEFNEKKRIKRKSSINEKSFNRKTDETDMMETSSKDSLMVEGYIRDIDALNADLLSITAELKSAKEELEKSKEYCIALETATEEMERKLEISNNNLEKALSENGELKIKVEYLQASHQDSFKEETDINEPSDYECLKSKYDDIKVLLENTLNSNEILKVEIDALKIDCVSYKCDNDDLFKKKNVLEEQLKSLSKDYESIKVEKEDLFQKLVESEEKVLCLNNDIEVLENKVNELIKSHENSKRSFENSLESSKDELQKAVEELKSVNEDYDQLVFNCAEQKKQLLTLESECASVKKKMAQVTEKNEILEEKYASLCIKLESTENEKEDLHKNLIESEKKVASLKDEIEVLEKKINDLVESQEESKEEYESTLKKAKHELAEVKETLKSVNQAYEETLLNIENKSEKLNALETECTSVKEEMAEIVKKNKVLEEKYTSISDELKSEKLAAEKEIEIINNKLLEALSALDKETAELQNLKNIIDSQEKDLAQFQRENQHLQSSKSSEIESGELACKKELEIVLGKLSEASCKLEEQKKKTEELRCIMVSYEVDTAELQKENKELKDKIKSKIESEVSHHKEVFNAATQKLSDALSELSEEKKKVDNLNNAVASHQEKVAELQKQNFELKDLVKFNESNTFECQKELEKEKNKLLEALSTLDVQEKELENFKKAINVSKLEILELQKQNFELQQKLKHESESKSNAVEQEIDPVSDKLNEILRTVDELEKLRVQKEFAENKVTELLKIEEELKKEICSQNTHTDTLYELLHLLEKCEMQATKKTIRMRFDFKKLNEIIKKLEAQLKENKDKHETECNDLKEMIKLLQKCELLASNKTKELHKSSITHLEQIMDLEKCVKQRDDRIESLKNDNNQLQKQLKNLQDTSKKQLQTQKQQFTVEISNIKLEKSTVEKEIKNLKEQMTKLTTEKGKLQTEIKNIKAQLDEVTESKNMLETMKENLEKEMGALKNQVESKLNHSETPIEEKLPEKRTLRKAKKGKMIVEEKSETKSTKKNEKEKDIVENKSPEEKTVKKAQKGKMIVEEKSEIKSTKNGKEKDEVENKSPEVKTVKKAEKEKTQAEKNTNVEKKSPKMKQVKKSENQGDKKKSKSKKKITDKKSKTTIYEETDENINIENTPKMKTFGGRQLKSVENVTPKLNLASDKNMNLAVTKGLKRKGLNDSFEENFKEKPIIKVKKVKFQDIENNLDLNKPQNLRVQLLKATNTTSDISMPSPRMTRGRKRLCTLNAKENISMTKSNLKSARS